MTSQINKFLEQKSQKKIRNELKIKAPIKKNLEDLTKIIPIETRKKQYLDFYHGDSLSEIKFKYPSEYHLATVLDFLGIAWRYRPIRFPLEYKPSGEVTRFTPSLYLPNYGLFIEVCLEEHYFERLKEMEKLKEIDRNIKVNLIATNSVFEVMYQQIVNTGDTPSLVTFAHESEKDFARLLDSYDITWRYEPVIFPLEWDENRRVIESFSPDFHLPQFDLYIEMTTMRQALVTKKNKKIRKFRARYPNENLVVIYGKDYNKLKELGIIK